MARLSFQSRRLPFDCFYFNQPSKKHIIKNTDDTIDYWYHNKGLYLVKNTKLYVIEVAGVRPDGTFIYTPWEKVCDSDCDYEYVSLKLPGSGKRR